MTLYPGYKVAAAHLAPVFHDTDKTIDKACDAIAEAARNGARLIAFPESYIPGFPMWAGVVPPTHTHDYFRQLAAAAPRVDGPEIERLRAAAHRHDIFVSIGFTESTSASVGCLWNSNLMIGSDGEVLNHHRKIVPTFYEKLVWANGDGAGLRVNDTEIGRLGMLICGENTNPLARFSLIAQGEQVHIATYPAVYPTRPLNESGNYDLEQAIRIRAGAHSFEGKVFTIVAAAHYDDSAREAMQGLGRDALDLLEASPKAVSMIIDPTGNVIGEPRTGGEGLVYAEIDLAAAVEPKRIHDVVGYYNRFDIFHLEVDLSAHRPATFAAARQRIGENQRSPVGGAPPLISESNDSLVTYLDRCSGDRAGIAAK